MSSCKACRGTGLKPFHDPAQDHGRGRLLFTDNECSECGGKGYSNEGERPFDIDVFLNEKRITNVAVLATTSLDALRRAAEVLMETYPQGFKPGDMVAFEIEEP